jgi:LuxR family maltose regulon positive regulatory protein
MTPASHVATGSSPGLLESKLVPPHLALSLLARTQLSTLLQLGLAKRMVAVAAPAGYGKSTALSQFVAWAEKQGIVTAWLSLDAEDNDPLRFVHYLAGALNHADGELGRGALAQIGAGAISSIEAIVASLVHDLTTCGRRAVFVLDDFHAIENDVVHRKLEWLIAHTPPSVLFIVAGRTRVPLALSQLRVRDELLELDTSHLCLRLEEAAEFVSRISGAALDRRHVETLHGLTEGWIAGLQLASIARARGSAITICSPTTCARAAGRSSPRRRKQSTGAPPRGSTNTACDTRPCVMRSKAATSNARPISSVRSRRSWCSTAANMQPC